MTAPINASSASTPLQSIDAPTSSGQAPAPIGGLVPEPNADADIGFVVAKMIIENAFQSRQQARSERQQANAALVAAQQDQLKHMKEAAHDRYQASQMQAWGSIAEGGLNVFGGIATGNGDKGAGEVFDGFGKIYSGGFGLASAGSKQEADLEDAAIKAAEMEATAQKDKIDDANDEMKEAREHMNVAMDFLREFQSTQTKTQLGAIRG